MRIHLFVIFLLPAMVIAQKPASVEFRFPESVYDSCSMIPSYYHLTCNTEPRMKAMISNKNTTHFEEFEGPVILKLSYGQHKRSLFLEPGDSMIITLVNDSLDVLEFTGPGSKRNEFLTEFNKKFFSDSAKAILMEEIRTLPIDVFEKHIANQRKKQYGFFEDHDTTQFSRDFNEYIKMTIDYSYFSSLYSFLLFNAGKPDLPGNSNDILKVIMDKPHRQLINDDAMINEHYRAFITNYISYYSLQSTAFNSSEAEKKFESSNTRLSGKTLVWYVADVLNCNYRNMSPSAIKMALDELDSIDTDSDYSQDFRKKFGKYTLPQSGNIKKSKYNTLADVELKDINGKKFNIEDLKGKVVYVDFWASWCGPCRQEFPSSKVLLERFTKKQLKKIAFVYISIDDNETAWKKAAKEIDSSGIILLVPNGRYAFYQTDIEISSVPRYLVINKSGKVVDYDAPRPSSKDAIYNEIIKLIKE